MRESPAIPIIRELQAEGAEVRGYDPIAGHEARGIFGESLALCETLSEALRDCDAAVLITARWKEFESVRSCSPGFNPQPLFVDGRRMLDKASIDRYEGIGV